MNQSPTYRLSCDIRSSVKSGVLYGKKGEPVQILADHDKVLIVQGECGRFPVLKQDVTDKDVEDIFQIEQQPTFVPQKAPAKRSQKKEMKLNETLSLF